MKREEIERTVANLVQPMIDEREDLHLVDVEYVREGKDWTLRVYIDKDAGVTLDDCEWVSRRLNDKLDEIDPIPGSYNLEVSSPGLERPLKKDSDYELFAGKLVHLSTYAPFQGRKEWEGHLLGLQDGAVAIQTKQGKIQIPKDQIAKARLAIEF